MDRVEAIKILVRSRPAFDIGKSTVFTDAYDMAIAALREQEQLRHKLEMCQKENNRLVLKYAKVARREQEQREQGCDVCNGGFLREFGKSPLFCCMCGRKLGGAEG